MKLHRTAMLFAALAAIIALASGDVFGAGGRGGGGGGGQRRGGGQEVGPGDFALPGGELPPGGGRGRGGRRGPGGWPGQEPGRPRPGYDRRPGGATGAEYDLTQERTMTGTVVEDPGQGEGGGLGNVIRIRTQEGEEIRVQLGPPWYRSAIGVNPQPGDEVEVVAAPGAAEGTLVARELSWKGDTYRFRQREGQPLWAGARRQEWNRYVEAWRAGPEEEIVGQIEGIETITPGGDDMGRGVVLRVRTRERTRLSEGAGPGDPRQVQEQGGGQVSVHLGPYWFVQRSMPDLGPGQQVTVRGVATEWGGQGVVVASEIERGQQRLRVRSEDGAPAWPGGWQNWDGWGPGSRYAELYNAKDARTVGGQIESVEIGRPMDDMGEGLVLTVKARDGKEVRAQVGPAWFVEQSGLKLAPGDDVTLAGSLVELDGKPVLMVSDVMKAGERVQLRERDGTPVWSGREPAGPLAQTAGPAPSVGAPAAPRRSAPAAPGAAPAQTPAASPG